MVDFLELFGLDVCYLAGHTAGVCLQECSPCPALAANQAGWLADELGFPDKADKRAQPGSGWTPAELNHILQDHVVNGALTTFGCVEWESDLFLGIMRARCYPFNMPKRRFHSFNPKVGQSQSCYLSAHA